MPRVFVAVPVEDRKIQEGIRKIQKKMAFEGVKLVEAGNLHITLKFLGNCSHPTVEAVEECVETALREFAQFRVLLSGVGSFSGPRGIRVIWIGVKQGQRLTELANSIDASLAGLGFQREREFIPHLTIARVKKPRAALKLKPLLQELANAEIGELHVNRVILFESKLAPSGPVYTPLHEWVL